MCSYSLKTEAIYFTRPTFKINQNKGHRHLSPECSTLGWKISFIQTGLDCSGCKGLDRKEIRMRLTKGGDSCEDTLGELSGPAQVRSSSTLPGLKPVGFSLLQPTKGQWSRTTWLSNWHFEHQVLWSIIRTYTQRFLPISNHPSCAILHRLTLVFIYWIRCPYSRRWVWARLLIPPIAGLYFPPFRPRYSVRQGGTSPLQYGSTCSKSSIYNFGIFLEALM